MGQRYNANGSLEMPFVAPASAHWHADPPSKSIGATGLHGGFWRKAYHGSLLWYYFSATVNVTRDGLHPEESSSAKILHCGKMAVAVFVFMGNRTTDAPSSTHGVPFHRCRKSFDPHTGLLQAMMSFNTLMVVEYKNGFRNPDTGFPAAPRRSITSETMLTKMGHEQAVFVRDPSVTSVGASENVVRVLETTAPFSSGGFSNHFPMSLYQTAATTAYFNKLGNSYLTPPAKAFPMSPPRAPTTIQKGGTGVLAREGEKTNNRQPHEKVGIKGLA
ncbi:hypothetical protein V8E53_010873 [Lactarius tabidus]